MTGTGRVDADRVGHVLAGLRFPAAKWQLIMHAEDYGADATTRTELWGLPASTYESLRDVQVALGRATVTVPHGYRPVPLVQAAALDRS